jgi:hypothetical protein
MTQFNVEKVVEGFIKLRDKKQELVKKHKEELAPINDQLALMEGWLQRDLQSRSVKSQKTTAGTAYLATLGKATVRDRDALVKFVIQNNMFDLFENKVSKSVVEDYLENTGDVVPGVEYNETVVCRIRR